MTPARFTFARVIALVSAIGCSQVPPNTSADVHASTVNGNIRTDFPLTVQGKFVGRHLDGKIGSGGRELKLNTVNGSIQLRQTSGKV